VLIPYFRDDPTALLHSLLSQTTEQIGVEILIYDDGTGDAELNAKVCAAVKSAHSPVHLMIAHSNKGRSAARNALQQNARADWVLFLDADMRPVSHSFLKDYVSLIGANAADVIFGGSQPAKPRGRNSWRHPISRCAKLCPYIWDLRALILYCAASKRAVIIMYALRTSIQKSRKLSAFIKFLRNSEKHLARR